MEAVFGMGHHKEISHEVRHQRCWRRVNPRAPYTWIRSLLRVSLASGQPRRQKDPAIYLFISSIFLSFSLFVVFTRDPPTRRGSMFSSSFLNLILTLNYPALRLLTKPPINFYIPTSFCIILHSFVRKNRSERKSFRKLFTHRLRYQKHLILRIGAFEKISKVCRFLVLLPLSRFPIGTKPSCDDIASLFLNKDSFSFLSRLSSLSYLIHAFSGCLVLVRFWKFAL